MSESSDSPQRLMNNAIEALKLAYDNCPGPAAGSSIITAFKAIIQLQNGLEKTYGTCCREQRGNNSLAGCCRDNMVL